MLLIPAFRRLRLKESEFKVTLGYIKPYLKNAKSKTKSMRYVTPTVTLDADCGFEEIMLC